MYDAVALVSADKLSIPVETVDGQQTGIGTPFTVYRTGSVGEAGELCKREGGCTLMVFFVLLHGMQCTAIGSHQTGFLDADDFASQFHFERTQYRIVEKGSSLHNDVPAEQGRVG
ncbi:hypothetical protein DSECCO2_527590 [anaerobic digester metagenome]